MLTLSEMKKIRLEKNVTYEEIANLSGISISSVQKIFGSDDANPRRVTIERLNKAFSIIDSYYVDAYSADDRGGGETSNTDYVSDVRIKYNSYGQGKMVAGGNEPIYTRSGYTYEDYLALELPEGKRVEIIDGVIYDMASPTETHQGIISHLLVYLSNELRKRNMKCLPFTAPFDVRLDYDEGPTTVVQPDIILKCPDDEVVRDEEGKQIRWIPRFVLEVLSPSTRKKDMYIKTKKYMEAGVVEYWMIDNDKKQVIKHNFENDTVEIFGYEDKIGIDIYNEDIKIDMKELNEYLEEYKDLFNS